MNRKLVFLIVIALFLAGGQAFAQIRLQGEIVDEGGKPVAGAKVTFKSARVADIDPVVTDKRGRWAVLLPVSGRWDIDIAAEGFVPSLGTVNASETERMPRIKTVLQKKPEPVPQPKAAEVVSSVPPEAVDAVNRAEAWVRMAEGTATAEDALELAMSAPLPPVPADEKKALYTKAVAEFERAHALLPGHVDLKKALSRAYYAAGQIEPAIRLLKEVRASEPDNAGISLLLVNLLAEAGNLEEARQVLDALPPEALSDTTAVVNVGILFLNKAAPKEALVYFDRAVSIDPSHHEPYYYRAIARLQLKEMARAKADLQKVIELGPDTPEAGEARDLLAQIK